VRKGVERKSKGMGRKKIVAKSKTIKINYGEPREIEIQNIFFIKYYSDLFSGEKNERWPP